MQKKTFFPKAFLVLILCSVNFAFAQYDWTKQVSGTTVSLKNVIWADSQFVVVGGGGTILTSPDGIKWSKCDTVTSSGLNSVAWTGSQFVAVGGGEECDSLYYCHL